MDLLWAVAVILFVAWLGGFMFFHVTTAFIHLLLVLAVVSVLARLFMGRRV
jgi:Family of unknown function (DUF5670)